MQLENCILFRDLSKAEIERALNDEFSKLSKFQKGEKIFTRGEIPKYVYVLIKGSVRIEKTDLNGKQMIVNDFIENGTVFAEVYAYLDDKLYDYTCVATSDSEVLSIDKKLFKDVGIDIDLQRKLSYNMISILAQKAYYLNQKTMILNSYTLRQKLANFLIQKFDGYSDISIEFNREDLASFLGTTRPSLSRELGNMTADGLIDLRKNSIRILDREGLEELL
ncbi:MAG: Crp/Fnr family transcriptional regulator [Clostridioides sp.]|jgi:CRP-like cAMP-binding protein|nr:Crp/Fnr family transcriptional regulator [Clostridioides sp.]